MVTDREVRRLMELLGKGMSLASAAAKAGMDEKTARKYRGLGKLPNEVRVEHFWRTREDPFDEFSRPLKVEKRELCTLYYLRPRKKWAGRHLLLAYDERFPLVPEFKCRYSYIVRYLEKGNCAGNHYHIHKAEIMHPLVGEFEIKLEDIPF